MCCEIVSLRVTLTQAISDNADCQAVSSLSLCSEVELHAFTSTNTTSSFAQQVEDLHAQNLELKNTISKFGLELRPLTTDREGHIKDRNLARPRMQV